MVSCSNSYKMEELTIEKSWHKANSPQAMTKNQLEYIYDLRTEDNCDGWDFRSKTNAMRSLTKSDASEIIQHLESGGKIIIE